MGALTISTRASFTPCVSSPCGHTCAARLVLYMCPHWIETLPLAAGLHTLSPFNNWQQNLWTGKWLLQCWLHCLTQRSSTKQSKKSKQSHAVMRQIIAPFSQSDVEFRASLGIRTSRQNYHCWIWIHSVTAGNDREQQSNAISYPAAAHPRLWEGQQKPPVKLFCSDFPTNPTFSLASLGLRDLETYCT